MTFDSICAPSVPPELIQTEFHHVRTLRIMEGVYRRGMQEEVMLEAGVVHTIFPCLDQLLEWHSGFLSELLSRRKQGLVQGSPTNFTVRRIGDLLLRQVRGQGVTDRREQRSCSLLVSFLLHLLSARWCVIAAAGDQFIDKWF